MKKTMLPSHFYSVLNSYFYNRKTVDYLEWRKSKGFESPEDSKRLDECTIKVSLLEKELYEVCCNGGD